MRIPLSAVRPEREFYSFFRLISYFGEKQHMEIQLRRNQNSLGIIGTGVVAFGVWSVIKMTMYFLLSPEELRATLNMNRLSKNMMIAVYIALAMILVIELVLRLYVGFSARAEGRDREKGNGYIIVAGLLVMLNILCFAGNSMTVYLASDSIADMVVSMAIELTSMITLVDLIIAAIRSRKLKRLLGE